MPGGDDKRFYRDLKRKIKKAGNRAARREARKALEENPSEAHWHEHSYGENSSEWLNGMDEDKTRERKAKHPADPPGGDSPPDSE